MKRRHWILIILLSVALFYITWVGFIHQHRGRESLSPITDKVSETTENVNRIGRKLKPIPPDEEKRMGQKLHRRMASRYSFLPNHHALTGYVRNVGINLLTEANDPKPFDYQFFVVDSSRINAFALPGGYIYITDKMLQDVIQTEAELAGLLGHEIAHVELDHCSDLIRYHQDRTGRKVLPLQLVQRLFRLSYSERLERSADQFGVKLAARNGYHPMGLKTLFSRMLSLRNNGTGSSEEEGHRRISRVIEEAIQSYLRTHPKLSERVESITDWVHGHSEWIGRTFYTGTQNFQQQRSKFQVQFDDEHKSLSNR